MFFVVFWIYSYNNIWNTTILKQDFNIGKWDLVSTLPQKLNLSLNIYLYKLWIKLNYSPYNLQIWSYSLDENISLNELFDNILKHPNSKDIKVTILPWWNIFDIDAYLSDNWVIKKWELISFSKNIWVIYKSDYSFLSKPNSLEWFIYPDTYRLPVDWNLDNFLKVVLDEFKDKIYSKYWDNANFYDKIIIASILEREEKNIINKPIVAGILEKRLNENIALGADATVCYSYELTQKECTPTFIWNNIYKKSDYNTRSKIWLPPTPISNFTDDTMDAVVSPKSSPYYYYLHDLSWNIYYGKTLEDHNKNKIEHLN